MATLTQGYTFGASETVTNAKLHSLVTGATFNSLVNADIDAAAAIAYSKLNLAGSIVNADIHTSAAIAYSKLNLATSIVNADVSGSAAIAYSKLNLASSIVNADVSGSAAIAYAKLNLATSIVNADISASAAIAYSKLALTNSLVAGDLTDGAVTGPKIAIGSDAQGDILYHNGTAYTRLGAGTSGQFLKTQGTGANPVWDTVATSQDLELLTTSDAEATTTSTSTTDLKTFSSLSISVEKPIRILLNTRKTSGAAADYFIGLKINGTQMFEARASSATDTAESGFQAIWIGPRRTNYGRAGGSMVWSTTGFQTKAFDTANMTDSTITSLTITGKSGSGSITIGVADVKVYTLAGS